MTRRRLTHAVDRVRFIRGDSDGSPVTCTCGWHGKVAGWADHRGVLARNIERSDGRTAMPKARPEDHMAASERWR